MKCPNCKSEMVKGILRDYLGTRWWESGKWFGAKSKSIIAYLCNKCGKVELTTEVKK